MQVQTTRFGPVEIAEDRVIRFPKTLLGFPGKERFCLLQPGDDALFFWLQSLDDPELAFVVTDPTLFYKEYSVPIRKEQMSQLGLAKLEDAQVFVIVNKIGQQLTGNLQGPLVINTLDKVGEQLVLADKQWTTRQPLMEVGSESGAGSGSGTGSSPPRAAASA
ncbi:MAG: flagellar assembly protein FliW [Planctomycetota bacterium]